MGELTGFTRSYLAPAPDSPWAWDEDGEVLTWANGGTIAFLPEVRAVLARVAREAQFVPPFTALALLLFVLRQEPRGRLPEERRAWIRSQLEGEGSRNRTRIVTLLGFTKLEQAMELLARLPADFWARPEAKEVVAAAVFDAAAVHRDPSQAALLVRALEHGLPPWSFAPREDVGGRHVEVWNESFSLLLHGFSRLSVDSILLRAQTGLTALPTPAEIELRSRGSARELLEDLRTDVELAGVVDLARRLLAAMYLPRPIAAREDLPLGGVSDITNRGSLERLLPSELAHDDLTLAVRLALNEALYTRRESPPRPRTGARCILIDAGIRMWGLPRVFAASVGLALAASAERGWPVHAWHSTVKGLARVDLSRRDGLVELLSALDSAPHPGLGVERFLDELSAAGEGSEAFLVTHERVLSDPGFRPVFAGLGKVGARVVQVGADGKLRIEAHSSRGARLVHEAKLDLSVLLKEVPARVKEGELEAPRFLSVFPSPLLLPHRLTGARFVPAPPIGVVAWTPEQDVTLWTEPGLFARIQGSFPGPNKIWWLGCDEEARVRIVRSSHDRGILLHTLHLRSQESHTIRLCDEPRGLQAAHAFGESFLLAGAKDSWWIEGGASSQPRVTRLGARWLGGRYFSTPHHPLAILRLTPGQPSFEALKTSVPRAFTVFDRPGFNTPWCLREIKDGARAALGLSSIEGEAPLPISLIPGWQAPNSPVRFSETSADGTMVIDSMRRWGLHLQGRRLVILGPSSFKPVRGLDLRPRPLAIGACERGHLKLYFRGSEAFELIVGEGEGEGRLCFSTATDQGRSNRVPFENVRVSDRRVFKCATSPRGDRAFLDCRGLLHLVPADPSRPEMSIILAMQEGTAAWLSGRQPFGSKCFLPPETGQETPAAIQEYLEFFMRGFE